MKKIIIAIIIATTAAFTVYYHSEIKNPMPVVTAFGVLLFVGLGLALPAETTETITEKFRITKTRYFFDAKQFEKEWLKSGKPIFREVINTLYPYRNYYAIMKRVENSEYTSKKTYYQSLVDEANKRGNGESRIDYYLKFYPSIGSYLQVIISSEWETKITTNVIVMREKLATVCYFCAFAWVCVCPLFFL